jgi:twitching motility protein PilT
MERFLIGLADSGDISDIVVSTSNPVTYLHKGRLVEAPMPENLTGEAAMDGFYELMVSRSGKPADKTHAFEPSLLVGHYRFRVSYSHNNNGTEAVLRLLPAEIPRPEELLIDEGLVGKFRMWQNGLFIVCGATGSGKSTTIAALVQEWARYNRGRVITLEDPIEFVYRNIASDDNNDCVATFTQREVGRHCESYASGLKEALRQSPKVIVVQEIRDSITAEIAIGAALSGQLVVSTLHSGEAVQAIQSFVAKLEGDNIASSLDALSSSLRGILAQRLVYNPEEEKRVAVHEILYNADSTKSQIRRKDYMGIRQSFELSGRSSGMKTFTQSVEERIRDGFLPPTMRSEFSL